VGIGIAGIQGKEGSTLLDMERFLKLSMSTCKRTEVVYGALPGEVLEQKINKKIAAELGKALFASIREIQIPHCPLCGGSTFLFLSSSRIRCVLCSNSGTLQIKANGPAVVIEQEGSGLFFSKKEAGEHEEWLRERVGEYSQRREKLNAIRSPYRDGWDWIKP
jgi:ribosomal protein S27E